MPSGFVGSLCLLAAAGMWGGMYVVGKYALEYISPFVLLWLRYLIAFVILFICWFFQKRELINRKDLPLIAWLGFIGYLVSNGGGFVGTQLSTAHMGALLSAASPAFSLVLAYFLIKEKLTWKKLISVVTSMCGLILTIGFEGGAHGRLLGNLVLLLGAFAWALYTVNVKGIGEKYSSLTITTFATGAALLLTTPAMLMDLEPQDLVNIQKPTILMGTLYLSIIATAAAFFLWNKGMEMMEAGIGSMFYFFTPVIGGLLSWIFLKENISQGFIAGGLLIIGGTLILVNKKPQVLAKVKHKGMSSRL
ncbi:EamA family transporter [Neobacillus cucumis]|uniref:DMT family transporter n=1 Tax=Neobacillus cucumis TaxID=1740721 RepID=UPI0018E04C4E|nr:EamA family transporter [Neobacillus cucumis]MBI0580721.1 EamA family transporter [Neobacillus cucumis]